MLLKITEKFIRENAFGPKKKEAWVKFNSGLSANRHSNKCAQAGTIENITTTDNF